MALRATDLGRTYTTEEFESLPEFHGRYELINGRLVQKPMPGFSHSDIAEIIHEAIKSLDRLEKLGLMRYEVRLKDKRGNYLIPDLSYWVAARRPKRDENNDTPAHPDFAVEIQSPEQSVPLLVEKIKSYLEVGVQVAWLVQPKRQLVTIYRQGQEQPDVVQLDGELDAGEVIPGFKLAMRDLFPQ